MGDTPKAAAEEEEGKGASEEQDTGATNKTEGMGQSIMRRKSGRYIDRGGNY